MVNYIKKAVTGTSSIFIFSILGSFFAYLARIVLARNLTTAEFGLFFAVFSFFSFFGLFKTLGFGKAMVKYLSEYNSKGDKNRSKTVVLSSGAVQISVTLLFTLIILFLSGILTKYYFKNEKALPIIIILAFWFLSSSLCGTIFQIFYGLQSFFIYSLNQLSRNFLQFIFLLILLSLGFGIFSPAYAWLFSSVLLFFLAFPILIKKFNIFKYKTVDFKKITKKLMFFSIPVMLTSIGGKVIGYIDVLILTYFRSLSEVGIYNVVLPTSTLLLLFGKSLGSVVFPISSELWSKKENKKLIQGLEIMQKYAFFAVMPIGLSLIAFSKIFLRLFFGKDYVAGSLAFQILILGIVFYLIGQLNNSILSGIGKPKKVSKIILIAAFVNALVNIILIPIFGIEGAAIATSLSYLLVCVLSIKEISKVIEFRTPWKAWFKLVIGGVIFILTIALLRFLLDLNPWIELFIVIIPAIVLYIIWVLISKTISIKEVKKLSKAALNR